MSNTTVIYYSSNTEEDFFASRIREQLVRAVDGKHNIISVTQKPTDLGKNICVGEVGNHDWNAFRQLRIGIEAAETKFIYAAEADVLYPPGYFDWEPPTEDCYRYSNFWCIKKWIGRAWGVGFNRKRWSEGAQVAGRDYWLSRFEAVMKDGPTWMEPGSPCPFIATFGRRGFLMREEEDCKLSVVGIKSGAGLRKTSGTMRHIAPVMELPYWGAAHDVRVRLFGACQDNACNCSEIKGTTWA